MCRSVVAERRRATRRLGVAPGQVPVLALAMLSVILAAACSAASATPAPAAIPSPSPAAVVAPEVSEAPSPTPTESPAEPSPAPLDPCALITRDEADALAGVKVLDPQPAGNPPSRCVWPTPVTGAVGQVEIEVGDGARKAYDIDATVLHHDFTPVARLGDEAYMEDKAIFFRAGDTWVEINVVRLDAPSRLPDMLVQLARTVAGRL